MRVCYEVCAIRKQYIKQPTQIARLSLVRVYCKQAVHVLQLGVVHHLKHVLITTRGYALTPFCLLHQLLASQAMHDPFQPVLVVTLETTKQLLLQLDWVALTSPSVACLVVWKVSSVFAGMVCTIPSPQSPDLALNS